MKTQSNMNETGGSRENNIEADAYAIFPEIRTSINKFKPEVSKKDNKKSLPELKYNEALSKAAIVHTNDIGQFGLTGQEGSRDSTKMGESGY